MSQTQSEGNSTLNALRAAATTGLASALRDVKADAVVLHEDQVLHELLQLCCPSDAGHNLALLNAAWKLLLSVASLPTLSERLYSRILHFMFLQLRRHIFSHDWSDMKLVKLATFVASHAVSGVRAHPSYAARNTDIVKMTVELYSTVCLTVATSERVDAARLLYQCISVRMLAILEAMGSACNGPSPLSVEEQLQLILHCLAGPPSDVAAALAGTSVAAISSLSAMSAMMAVTRSLLLSETVCVELLLAASLLWLPGMHFVLADGDDGEIFSAAVCAIPCDDELGAALCRRVAQHARDVPLDVFFAECDNGNDDAAESSEELSLDAQLLSVLRALACKSVAAVRRGDTFDGKRSSCSTSLLRFRVFGILLAALLVLNDASTARVLLVWETVMSSLSDADRRALGTELLQLGEGQLRVARELSNFSSERVVYLRRFLNATAVLLAEICRLLRCPPDALSEIDAQAATSAGFASSNELLFCHVADVFYHQTRVYQWWNEEAMVENRGMSTTERGGDSEETKNGLQMTIAAAATSLHEELQVVLGEWRCHSASEVSGEVLERMRVTLLSIPRRIGDMLHRLTSFSGGGDGCASGNIMAVLLASTRLIQSVAEATSSTRSVRVCVRFVAAELVAVMGFLPFDDPTFLACLRRLVEIGFSAIRDEELGVREGAVQLDGILQYHAAVCLQHFAQRNTFVQLGRLQLTEATSSALMQLLQGGRHRRGDDNDKSKVDDAVMRACEGLLAQRGVVWQNLVSQCSQATAASSETMGSFFDLAPHGTAAACSHSYSSSQNDMGCHDGRFLLPLRRCEDTLRLLLQWQEKTGRVLDTEEEDVLGRLEQLVCTAANMARTTLASSSEKITSADAAAAATTTTTAVAKTRMTLQTAEGESPEVIHID